MIRSALSAVTLGLLLAACQSEPQPPAADSGPGADGAAVADSGPAENTTFAPDGVEIYYRAMGRKHDPSDPVLLFVHGWSCSSEFWREQLPVFAKSYRVVALDLGGHGNSGTDRAVWTIAGLAQDVQAVADELKLDNIILVGHSMGGPVSLAAAARLNGRVQAVVGVDTLHNAEIEYPAQQVGQMMAAFQTDFSGTMRSMFDGMAGAGLTAELRDWIVDRARQTDPEAAVALFGDFARISLPDMLQKANTTVTVINAAPGPMQPVTEVETNRRYADFQAVLVDGVGHFLQLEKPDRFNSELQKVLDGLAEQG